MSAPSPVFRLSAPLACLALALGGCFGGPTSDFPNKANDDGAPGNNGSPDGEGNTGGSNSGGSTGGNSDPSTDNGSGGGGTPDIDAGEPPFGGDADGGTALDGGGGDAGLPEAGAGCEWSSPAPDAEHCSGSYCDTSRAALPVTGGAACSSSSTLDAVCAGDPLEVVGNCFRTLWLSGARVMAVKGCAVADDRLANVSGGCIDCYVAMHECMADACTVECVTDAGAACEACTLEHCGAAFSTCSGLPRP